MSGALKLMESLARQAGGIQLEHLGESQKIEYKGSINIVTEVDRECERLIVAGIEKHFPKDDILAEEGSGKRSPSGRRWIIDPLDGTVNYAHNFPFFCVSIALEEDGILTAGVIYDPNRDEMFSAEKGRGASLNGRRMNVSSSTALKQSLVATGFAYFDYEARADEIVENLANFGKFIQRARAVRRPGSAAIDLAWVACGRIDGFWELHLKPWDMAAGVLIVTEAGGCVTTFDGRPFDLYGPEILASNGRIHDEMAEVLKREHP